MVSLKILYEETGYAYISIFVAPEATVSLRMEFERGELEIRGFYVKKPYKYGGRVVVVEIRPGESKIVLFKVVCENTHEKMVFPPPSLKLYEV